MEAAAAAQPLRLPTFTPLKAEAWFSRAETIFRRRTITSQRSMADAVLEILPDEVWDHIAPWMEAQETLVDYDTLKARLMTMYSASPADRG